MASHDDARAAFARLAHSHAHEVLALRALLARCRREEAVSLPEVEAIARDMIAERARRIGASPDSICDAYEAASLTQAFDLALLSGEVGHA